MTITSYKSFPNNNKVACPCKQGEARCMLNAAEMMGGFPSKCLCNSDCVTDVSVTADPDFDQVRSNLRKYDITDYNIQSAETHDTNTQEQIVGFMDDKEGEDTYMPESVARNTSDVSHNASLGEFLKRPTKIYEYTWQLGTTIPLTNIDPWTLFFNNPLILKKLDNYAFIRCDLNIKIVINASPFYYGAAIVSYLPMPEFQPQPLIINHSLVPLSQRPNVYIYPQSCQGGNITLPFVYHEQWLPTDAASMAKMGKLIIQSFDDLQNANSVVSADCDITMYAWATNVELAGPTTLDALQSGEQDEYSKKGAVSKPASAIARYASLFTDIPVIGPYMTATSMLANAVGNVASLFGYSNTPVIDDVHFYRNATLTHLASTDIGKATEKLTLDSKNELSIDPSISGVKTQDDLAITNFCGRESYLTSFDWTSVRVSDDLLWNIRCYSYPHVKETATGYNILHTTPLFMVANMFNYWRGDLIYRFKIIASAYHKGRLQVSWCPNSTPGSAVNSSNALYTKIFDITENSDIEFRVPYLQSTAMLQTGATSNATQFATTAISNDTTNSNGVLIVKVVNRQTSPVASATIKVLVFVKAAENIEFANPVDIPLTYGTYAIQSGEIDYDISSKQSELGTACNKTDPNLNLIYCGETVRSLRTLFNRSGYFRRYGFNQLVFGSTNLMRSIAARLPLYPGFDPNGIHSATGITSGLAANYNYVNWHPVTWISQCFLFNRGSIDWQLSPNDTDYTRLLVDREDRVRLSAYYDFNTTFSVLNSKSRRAEDSIQFPSSGNCGMAFTNPRTQSCLSVTAPMYSNKKFMANKLAWRTLGNTEDNSNKDTITFTGEMLPGAERSEATIDLYVSAGIDYSLLFFLNTPIVFKYDDVPPATV